MAEEINETKTLNLLNIRAIIENHPVEKDSLHRILHEISDEHIDKQEKLGNLDKCRLLFNSWINTLPPLSAWLSYINFELRHGDVDQARVTFEALVKHLPDPSSWVHYAEFEFNYGSRVGVRICGERAMLSLKDKNGLGALILAFAKFEEQCNELENAARLYKSVLDNCIDSKDQFKILYKKILDFEKRHGEKRSFVKKVLSDRRDDFEGLVKTNPLNYNAWWDYIHMEETIGDENSIRLLYMRALENVPKIEDKSYWKKYVYLWILYALFEEIDAGDIDRARQAYRDCIKLIPHEKFSFSKIWVFSAVFEIKQLQVDNMRKILDFAIMIAPKEKILRKYLHMEDRLGNVQQCRMLYTKIVQYSPDDSCEAWIECAQFEIAINETERARFIFELAVSQPALHNSELLWKAYTEFEISVGEIVSPRELHANILSHKNHLNVWISSARFEAYGVQEILMENCVQPDDDVTIKSSCLKEARKVFYDAMKCNGCFDEYRFPTSELEHNQNMIVFEWLDVERSFGDLGNCGLFYDQLHWGLKMKVSQYNDQFLHHTIEDSINMEPWVALSDVED